MPYEPAIKILRVCFSDDLKKPKYRGTHPMKGACYVVCEALYHLYGGKASGLVPCVMHVEGDTHWYLKTQNGEIIDPTADQFSFSLDYSTGRGSGFLTRHPSKRAQRLVARFNAAVA